MSLLRQRPVSASPFMKSEVAMMCLKGWTKRQSGQAMVETAIVMPLFIFIVLGLIQMTQVFQTRSMLKYAAYRAARAGAMHSMDVKKMEKEALIALSPVISTLGYIKAPDQPLEVLAYHEIASLLNSVVSAIGSLFDFSVLKVVVCGPLKPWLSNGKYYNYDGKTSAGEVDFDDPRNTYDNPDLSRLHSWDGKRADELEMFERTKLRIQVQYNHRLIIPFANWVIYKISTGRKVMEELRLNGKIGTIEGVVNSIPVSILDLAAAIGVYFLPMYANYAFRMQSNFKIDDLPEEETCIAPSNENS